MRINLELLRSHCLIFLQVKLDDKRKRELIRIIYHQMKNNKDLNKEKKTKISDETPLNILKIRYAKGKSQKKNMGLLEKP